MQLSEREVRSFYLHQLNLAYCSLSHLAERISELSALPAFDAHSASLAKTAAIIEQRITTMDKLYLLIGEEHSFSKIQGAIEFTEQCYTAIHQLQHFPALQQAALKYYIRMACSIEIEALLAIKSVIYLTANPQFEKLLDLLLNSDRTDGPFCQNI